MAKKKTDANPTPEAEATEAEAQANLDSLDIDQAEVKAAADRYPAAGTDKKAADKSRRDAAIGEHQAAVADAPGDKDLEKSDKAKAKILAKMEELADEVAKHDEAINVLREESAALLLQLYPQQGENDKHSVAVRGYINASARERKHRALAPGRLKALLEKAGMAPIDAAFSRARGRGMARPARKVAKKAAAKKAE